MNTSRLLVGLTVLLSLQSVSGGDWPQWRGPGRDGHVPPGGPALKALPAGSPESLWRISSGPGHSGPVVAGEALIFLDQQNGKEVAHRLDKRTGKVVWSIPFAEPADYSNFGDGPRATPLIDEERVYVQSGRGEFRCLALADGRTLWGFSFEKDFGATFFGNKNKDPEARETAARRHGNNGSAVIDGDRIFVPVGSPRGATLVAFDKRTGKELWRAGNDNAAYSSLMHGTFQGVDQAIHFNADALMGVASDSGDVLWRLPVKTGAKRHTVTPLVVDGTVMISSHSVGTHRYRPVKSGQEWTAEPVWINRDLKTMLATPVLVGNHLYGLGTTRGKNTDFVCVNFANGEVVWSQPGLADYASVLSVGDKLLVLNSTGELLLLRANPDRYEELGRLQACGKTWSFPAYADGVLYVRDERRLQALQMAH